MTRPGTAALLAAALTLTACEDVTDPGGLGTFTLVEANGQPLPSVVFDGDTEFGHMVATATAGSITLRGDNRFTERLTVDIVLEGAPLGEETVAVSGDYNVDGQLVSFDPEQAGSVDFTGTLSGDGTVLTTLEEDPEFGTLDLLWEQ